MATGGGAAGAQVCPLCNAVVDGGDQLQLHYLTSCSGYDLGGSGGGGAREGKSPVASSPMATAATSPGAALGGVAPGNQCLVQFMWQPLTQMSYPKVTLLTSLGSGSIDLTIDPDGGHYSSDRLLAPSGTYEGQLVVGDSFINPVKQFMVSGSKSEEIIVLEFEVVEKTEGFGTGGRADENMYMQQNPSFNQSYGSYEGGGSSYHDRGTSYRQGRGKTGVSAGGDLLSNFDQRQYFENDPSYLSSPPVYAHTQTTPPGSRDTPGDTYSRQLSEDGFDPALVKPKSTNTVSVASRDSTSPGVLDTVSVSTTGVGGETEGKRGDIGHRLSPVGVAHGATVTSPSSSSSSMMVTTSGSEFVVGGGERVKSDPGVNGERFDWVGIGGAGSSSSAGPQKPKRDGVTVGERREFSVDSLHNRRSNEDTAREMEGVVAELRVQLARVTEEKEALRQDRERVSAQWEGKVRRLRKKLGEEMGEEAVQEENLADELDKAKSRLDVMSAEIVSLSARLKEMEEEDRGKDTQLKEMKNMNAALENQLTEYMDALDHQNQSVQRTMESRQRSSAEVAQFEREIAKMTEYMRKQQLEYQEALLPLHKKMGRVEEMEKENLKIHQLNLNLTGELEDYRHQTKTLMADLRTKEEEVASLREQAGTRGLSSSDRSQLELDSMQQKCDAWREEVERLSPLREEVARLTQDNSRLQQELARVAEGNAELARQLHAALEPTQVGVTVRERSELERKARDYNQLMERVTELQQVRVQLEHELGPLRAERADILSENATLREGSNPERYLQLKSHYTQLSEQCVQLQKCLTEESNKCQQLRQQLAEELAINQKMEEANRELQQQLEAATDEKGLQLIRGRMERYKSEREKLKLSITGAQAELQACQEREQQHLQTIQSLRSALEEAATQSSHQDQTGAWQEQVASLSAQLEESNKRMYRYREERNTAKIMLQSLKEQINTLQTTVQQLQNSRMYDSYASGQLDTALLTRLQLTDDSTEPVPPGSPHEAAYSPDEYSDPTGQPGGGRGTLSGGRRRSKQSTDPPAAAAGDAHRPNRLSSSASSRGFSPSGGGGGSELYTEVATRDGVTRNLILERPRDKLSAKSKPEVVVKRRGGRFETGVLAFVGQLEGKEMAGVILDFPTGGNDGSFKDGKYYFRCTQGYGLYCPVTNIYFEASPSAL